MDGQVQDQQTLEVQPQQEGQGFDGQQQQQPQQKPIDYEKAYRNLEKEFTKKSQKLAALEKWEKFQQETGITAEQALQQLELYRRQFASHQYPQQTPTQAVNIYDPNNPVNPGVPITPYDTTFQDPRVTYLEQQLNELVRERQVQELRQKFPQFDELYPEVLSLADSQGLDLETAFGKILVNRWDEFVNQTKQQIVNDIRAKGMKSVESSQAPEAADTGAAGLTAEELEAARLMGIDPNEYARMKDVRFLPD